MVKYRLSNEAKEDLIRIHHYGVEKFGMAQADKYFDSFFKYFEIISQRPYSFESVDYIKGDIDDVFVALIVFISKSMVTWLK